MASESMHVFCCGIPTVISITSLLTGLGVASIMPTGILAFHNFMHPYEIPMIAVSGAVLAAGWAMYWAAKRVDCHNTGCCHEPCGPKKDKALWVLAGASGLFAFNTLFYFLFHAHYFTFYFWLHSR